MSLIPKTPQKPKLGGFPSADTWLFYGQPKVGKTTLGAQFPKSLLIDLEGGALEVEGFVVRPESMEELREIYDEIEEDPKRFDNIVIDSLDIVMEWIDQDTVEYCSEKFKKNYDEIGDIQNGAGWAESRKRMLGFVEAWKGLKKNIIFIAHAKAVMAEKGGVMEKSKTLDLPGKLAHRFPARIDNIGYCYGEREKVGTKFEVVRKISFQPYEELEAGCRRKQLVGKIIPMSFKDILAQFNGKTTPAPKSKPKKKLGRRK